MADIHCCFCVSVNVGVRHWQVSVNVGVRHWQVSAIGMGGPRPRHLVGPFLCGFMFHVMT
jgi:hypothetical protein